MAEDKELKSMSAVLTALEPLDAQERARVIAWASQKLSIIGAASLRTSNSDSSGPAQSSGIQTSSQYTEFHQLFDAAQPKTGTDRALIGGYWFQVCQNSADFTGQQVNDDLKQLGHPVTNITKAFERLQSHKPILARQVQKTGKTKQGRKRYKLTREGQARVEAMCRGESDED